MKSLFLAFVTFVAICTVNSEVYFEENFVDGKFIIFHLFYGNFNTFHFTGKRLRDRFYFRRKLFISNLILFTFTDSWEKNWIYSEHPGKEFGKFVLTAGKFYNDEEADKGRPTTSTHFYL